jgi:hypothetical protein
MCDNGEKKRGKARIQGQNKNLSTNLIMGLRREKGK